MLNSFESRVAFAHAGFFLLRHPPLKFALRYRLSESRNASDLVTSPLISSHAAATDLGKPFLSRMPLPISFSFAPSLLSVFAATTALAVSNNPLQERADSFLTLFNSEYQAVHTLQDSTAWNSSTDVTPEHEAASETATKAYDAIVGNPAVINEARLLLQSSGQLNALTVRELHQILLNAAEGPMTNPGLVAERAAAETKQVSLLNSFVFKLDGRPITANEIDDRLTSSRDLAARRSVWEASKETGPALKPGLIKLRELRNGVARELGHHDYFALQVASYDMSSEEMVRLQDDFLQELRPLFLQLHTWTKYKLAERYHQPVPRLIPAHWLSDRWAQEWNGLVESADFDSRFAKFSPEWIAQTAEKFYLSIGFTPLPRTFWERSDLYPVSKDSKRKKDTHAFCDQVDLAFDIRSLQNIEANTDWFQTAHHELGHAHYFMSYTRPEVPMLLRNGANPGFHEGMGELAAFAASQVPYLKHVGVLPADYHADETVTLLNDALGSAIPFMFWSSGTMTHWEADVYAKDLPPDQWNARWWQYVREFQGVEPPAPRGEEWCDAATKTHINDTPCYYYSYAVATVLKFQLHNYIARHYLHQPPQACNYAGHPEVGAFLRDIMQKGATEDWHKVLRDATGEDLSTRAMKDYFQPLMAWLQEQNKGRPIGWENPLPAPVPN